MRIAFDSNILIYLARTNRHPDDTAKIAKLRQIVDALTGKAMLIAPMQALGEMIVVMRRSGLAADRIRDMVDEVEAAFVLLQNSVGTMRGALDLMHAHKLQFWDSVILNAAAEGGCSMLLSEDMQTGFVWRGVTIVNPLAATPDPLLARLIERA